MNQSDIRKQQVFSFVFDDNYSFSRFIPGENSTQIAILQQSFSQATQSPQQVYISGASGSGCTHLLQAVCQQTIALGWRVASLSISSGTDQLDTIIEHLEHLDLIAIDDLGKIQNNTQYEYSLFNLFHYAMESHCSLLFASNKPATRLNLTLPDLQTRLASCLPMQIRPLTGDDLRLYIRRLFQARRIDIEDTIIDYILNHYRRSCNYLRQATERIEQESLRAHKPITKALVRSCLKPALPQKCFTRNYYQ